MEDLTKARAGKTDGRLFPVTEADLVRGNVLCTLHDDRVHTFSDCVIVDVFDVNDLGHRCYLGEKPAGRLVRLARPYVYVSSAETSCPGVLQGFEDYTVYPEDLTKEGSRDRVRALTTGAVDRRAT